MSIEIIWNKSLEFLKKEIDEIPFDSWIKTLKPISIINNKLYIEAPNHFNKDLVENRFGNLIFNVIKKITSVEYEIHFCLPDKNIKTKDNNKNNSINLFKNSDLNPKYIFDEFVIGNSNRFAHAASLAVAELPAKAYNPLFIYGGVGLGKTHLMHAIGHFISNKNANAKVVYVSSEQFTNEMINSIKDDKNEEFRNRYRNVDVLLVDDIQFIGGNKERTQEEFFHTFNTLYEANKQIVMTSDRPPKEIPKLEDRLRSRFEWGLITDIQAPDFETRIAILRKKAETESIFIPNEIYEFIAKKFKSNIRELEGALTRLIAYSKIINEEISLELSKEALKDIIISKEEREINVKLIKDIVSTYYNLKPNELESKKRARTIVFPRHIAMYLSRELTDLSLPKIGDEFGGRDHTTVIHACDKIQKELINNSELNSVIEKLKSEIKND